MTSISEVIEFLEDTENQSEVLPEDLAEFKEAAKFIVAAYKQYQVACEELLKELEDLGWHQSGASCFTRNGKTVIGEGDTYIEILGSVYKQAFSYCAV